MISQVMTQKHNRHLSIAVYISVLAIADNITLIFGESHEFQKLKENVCCANNHCGLFLNFFVSFSFPGLLSYLGIVHHLIPPDSEVYCSIRSFFVFATPLCGTFLILGMTFDRFYGIVKPHLASSFNTVKRAKIMCVSIILFCCAFNIPHLFVTLTRGYDCLPYGKALALPSGEAYYWISFVLNYTFPFLALLVMNSVIINTLRKRQSLIPSMSVSQREKSIERGKSSQRGKSSDSQVFVILLLITFAFLILTTPAYLLFLFQMTMDFTTSATLYAGWNLFFSLAQKLFYTNNGINFFLYILSGTKFRNDLLKLFGCEQKDVQRNNTQSTSGGGGSDNG